jgi:hypothetical protein
VANKTSISMLEALLAEQLLLPFRLRAINFLSGDRPGNQRIL